MRILQVSFKNLNSLVGEWQIDLTHPAFASDGIFAITGPTGAGKTTILDAICLALYGRTPRLSKVTKSGNEIMSRQTGECFAEVTFETQSGRYFCHWSQRRARAKPDGELQTPKHEISDAASGKIIESKIRGVAEQIEEVTGMDFDRFTRSMLLAQGDFATFLQASPDDRSPILEQITGTEIYSQISTRVHERQRDEKVKLNLIQAETAGIVFLDQDQEQKIKQTLETELKEEKNLIAKFTDTGKAIEWLTTINELKNDIASLAAEESQIQAAIKAFKLDQEKLDRALRAASLDGTYATLTAIRKQIAEDKACLKAEEKHLCRLEASTKEQTKALQAAEQQTARLKEAQKMAAPILQKVRFLDQKLTDQKKTVSESNEECKKDAAKIETNRKALLEEQKKRSRASEIQNLVDDYLKKHSNDEWLISGLAGIEEQLQGLQSKQQVISQKESDQETSMMAMDSATESFNDCQKQSESRKQELKEISKQLQQDNDALKQLLGDRLLREYRTEKETLLREMTFLTKITELEDIRAKLEDGKPCPLCGATEHPFAEGNIPVPDKVEQKIDLLSNLISKAEHQEISIQKLEKAESLARENLTNAEKLELTADNNKKATDKIFTEMKDSLVKLRADFTKCRQAITVKLQPLGISDIPETGISSLVESLRAQRNAWQTQVKEKADIEKQIANIDSDLRSLGSVIETQSTILSKKLECLDSLKKELVSANNERKDLYGDKNPDIEEECLNKTISDAESAEKQVRGQHNELQQKWNIAKANVESLEARIEKKDPELEKYEKVFCTALDHMKFSNEEQLLAAALSSEDLANLQAMARDIEVRRTDLKARQKDRETRLITEMAIRTTDNSLEVLESQFREQEKSLENLRNIIADLKHSLSENMAAKERIKEKQTAIESQKKEYCRWVNLHELIGSADGKKYRNFAQGLTFEIMVGNANQQLQKMTDRYLLTLDEAKPLELNVLDSYQAGEIRSTKNLSGGESFIISLSLALGLSYMASKNVRVDSLFLDEGFGTLDEDALDTSLETLASLQQDGKMIGIISHVPALKERISTQIQVIPQTGGRSQIFGPGCAISK
ncbi:exonuclease SbcC [Zymomonas mobilis]|uniref:Exonuclease SbcC n=1 Tax=Zymomonas mobilis TaxID=542 RepID=A0A542VUF1_ZYMMB|nr:AAA family ATPase [Zymomonas mobilis]TQL14952.1 exonuclease SbcC [Zymomonas mobilis]